jgi:hypothetical protein
MPGCIQRIQNPIYALFRRHSCPKCGSAMKLVSCSKTVNYKDPTANASDFTQIDGEPVKGNIYYTWLELKCTTCRFQISIKEHKEQYQTARN